MSLNNLSQASFEVFSTHVLIDDEAVQYMLPAKLQTQYPPVAYQRPCLTLGGGGPTAQLARKRESLRRSWATE